MTSDDFIMLCGCAFFFGVGVAVYKGMKK